VSNARILMYTQDSYGLGHLRRATNLANALVAKRADLSVLLVVDSPIAPFFELRPHVDFLKLPTVVKVGAGVFRTGQLAEGYEEIRSLRAHVLREAVLCFLPDVILVDHMPGGANRELLLTLTTIRRRKLATRMVLGLRDIVDSPEVTRAVWRHERVYEAMQEYYDRVLIYGSPEVFDTAAEYDIARVMGERIRYCGYVCNQEELEPPERVRARLGLGREPTVVVTAGGGADAYRLMHAYLEALPRLGIPSPATLMITGPFLPEAELRTLRERAASLPVQIRASVGEGLDTMNVADLVVCMAGYNTLSEVLRLGKRAIVVPRPGPSAEQGMRARLFAERGLVDVVEPGTLSASTLAHALVKNLIARSRPAPRHVPDLDGVERATEALLECLPSAPSPDRTPPVREATRAERLRSRAKAG